VSTRFLSEGRVEKKGDDSCHQPPFILSYIGWYEKYLIAWIIKRMM